MKLYINGMAFRVIGFCTRVTHNTVINWVKQADDSLPDAPPGEAIPALAQLDELQPLLGRERQAMAVDSLRGQASRHPDLAIRRSPFGDVLAIVVTSTGWQCSLHITVGWPVQSLSVALPQILRYSHIVSPFTYNAGTLTPRNFCCSQEKLEDPDTLRSVKPPLSMLLQHHSKRRQHRTG